MLSRASCSTYSCAHLIFVDGPDDENLRKNLQVNFFAQIFPTYGRYMYIYYFLVSPECIEVCHTSSTFNKIEHLRQKFGSMGVPEEYSHPA